MRLSDKNKKEKGPSGKTPQHTQTKKLQAKRILSKKQQAHPKKSSSSANLTKATQSGLSSGTQSAKYSQHTIKSTSKASLAQIRQIKQTQPKITQKNKFVKPFTKPLVKASKPLIVEKAKEEIKKSLANVIKSYYPQKKSCLDISMTQVTKDATQQKDDKIQKLSASEFHFLQIIGEGGYGKVWKVEHLKTRKQYAMKQMSKAMIIMKKSVENVLNQRKILERLSNAFIANMQFAFNDRDNLYLVMDLLGGGDLRYHIGRISRFSQEQVKFLIACVIVAVEYIHKNKVFHRDIKPENLVFDDAGYLKLTDFGIARVDNPSSTLDASGTPGYMAPEVLCKQVHSYCVDFYAVGVITYELIMGKRPYFGNNRAQIRDAILSKQHTLKKSQLPPGFRIEAADFVNRLILRQPASRMGSKTGVKELKNHLWFKGFSWSALAERKVKSPFKGKFNLEMGGTEGLDEEALMQYKLLQRADQKVDPFCRYYFQALEEK